jgi:hypothetical protein
VAWRTQGGEEGRRPPSSGELEPAGVCLSPAARGGDGEGQGGERE